jgi:GPH family glycoside/pentoside/hexuronide:cation symporter
MAIAQFIGQWAWVIAPWFWVFVYDPTMFEDVDTAVQKLSVGVAIPCTLLAMIPALFIKSRSTLDRDDFKTISIESMASSVIEILISTFQAFLIPQFVRLAIATFLVFNSFNIIASFTFYIIVYHMFAGDPGAAGKWPAMHGCVGALCTTFLVIPVVTQMSKKLGKKQTFIISQAISIIGYILFWFLFVPGKPGLFLWALPFHSFGIGGLFTLMMSMTADVCDIDEYQTGKRREGTIGAVYWWMVKFGHAFAGLLSGIILWWVDFDPDPVATQESITGLRFFYSALPILGVLGAIGVMWNYNVTEESAEQTRRALADRRATLGTH